MNLSEMGLSFSWLVFISCFLVLGVFRYFLFSRETTKDIVLSIGVVLAASCVTAFMIPFLFSGG